MDASTREIRYEDLALSIEPDGAEGFRVRALNTPYGLTVAPFALPFSREQLEALIEEIGLGVQQSREPGNSSWTARDLGTRPPQTVSRRSLAEIGGRLFRALFHEAVREVYLLCRGRSESTPDQGLRIRLVLPIDTPDSALLQALPWELLYCEETRDFLSRSVLTPVVRQLVIPWASSSFAYDLPERLRILIAVATPHGSDFLDTVDEQGRILKAWCEREHAEVDLLPSATLSGLREKLRSRRYQILHFIGHGVFEAGEGGLLFETSSGAPHRVSGDLLSEALRESRELRLAFLNACNTGKMSYRPGQDPLLGTATALVRRGVPAVLANQFPISDSAARVFSEAVYRSLARGSSLEAAVGDGRFAVYQEDTASWEWITPVLFTALSGADIFKPLVEPKLPLKPTPSPEENLSQARRLLAQESYEAARERIESARAAGTESADLHYYLAMALLQGRRPRSLKLENIRPVMASANRLLHLPDCAAHHYSLLAFLYKDFYVSNGFESPSPGYDALLRRAAESSLNREKLDELAVLVPWSKLVVDTVLELTKRGSP